MREQCSESSLTLSDAWLQTENTSYPRRDISDLDHLARKREIWSLFVRLGYAIRAQAGGWRPAPDYRRDLLPRYYGQRIYELESSRWNFHNMLRLKKRNFMIRWDTSKSIFQVNDFWTCRPIVLTCGKLNCESKRLVNSSLCSTLGRIQSFKPYFKCNKHHTWTWALRFKRIHANSTISLWSEGPAPEGALDTRKRKTTPSLHSKISSCQAASDVRAMMALLQSYQPGHVFPLVCGPSRHFP